MFGFAVLRVFCVSAVIALDVNAAEQAPPYVASGHCDGLPGIAVVTPPDLCVGLAAHGFKFPRGLLPLDNGDVLVADMGGWNPRRGSLWLLRKTAAGFERERLLDKLDRPNGILLGPDKRIYLGEVGRVTRFDLADVKGSLTDVIGGRSNVRALPAAGRHPLVSMVFGRDGHLYVNVGSATDNCETAKQRVPDPNKPCAEAEGERPRGALRRYEMQWPEGSVKGWRTYAVGLRNSMALAVHPDSGELLQGENSRDNIHRRMSDMENDEDLPHDELNVIGAAAHYGWPYCYDEARASPEYPKADCSRYRKPLVLLPAHAAPLGMTYYFGSLLPAEYRGHLIVAFHGYRAHGHRIVAYETDARGLPTGKTRDIVSGWEATDGRPLGAPTDIKVGSDGALYITEDRNGTVLRMAPAH